MKIGIIGGTGMLGHHLAIAAQLRQYQIRIIHRASSDLSRIADLTYESRIADLNDRGSLIRAMEGLDMVANCGAYYPTLPKPLSQEIKTARLQMQFFLDAVKEAGIQRALYLGGAIAMPKAKTGMGHEELYYDQAPENPAPYVQVKWLMDKMAREAARDGVPIVIGIPPMTFGEYDYGPTTGRLIVDLANQTLPAYIKGNRNVIYARDAGRGLLLALEKGRFGERYLITGHNTTTDDLVAAICQQAGVPLLKKTLPLRLAKIISKFQEVRYTLFKGAPPTLSSTAIAVLAGGQHLDGSKAKRELGYEPDLNIEGAIQRAHKWFEKEKYIE
ncbi:MAG: NAD-dependent epimerase/dehydratase family protein [Roseivirga sp.]|nr:NAD-dependent epimerase/dehydratase family protein [Roseivirga sp.]